MDPAFAGAFASVLVGAARRDAHGANVEKMQIQPVPTTLRCTRESSLYDLDQDRGLGRVDLRFEEENFTLFVENKLGAGYGHDQVKRYLRALELLPSHVPRRGLIAITRDVPGYGEPDPDKNPTWLGSVRWARILEDLRELQPQDSQVAQQWMLLLDLLDEQGDLGMTRVDDQLLRSWGSFLNGRDLVQRLLAEIQGRTGALIEQALTTRYPDRTIEVLVAPYRRGKHDQVSVVKGGQSVWFGFRVPAAKSSATMVVQFTNQFEDVHFIVEARPEAPEEVLLSKRFEEACTSLDAAGLSVHPRRRYMARVYGPQDYLGEKWPDLPERLLDLIERDVGILIGSGLFDAEINGL